MGARITAKVTPELQQVLEENLGNLPNLEVVSVDGDGRIDGLQYQEASGNRNHHV